MPTDSSSSSRRTALVAFVVLVVVGLVLSWFYMRSADDVGEEAPSETQQPVPEPGESDGSSNDGSGTSQLRLPAEALPGAAFAVRSETVLFCV